MKPRSGPTPFTNLRNTFGGRQRLLVVGLILALAVLSGCGNDETASSAGTPTPIETTEPVATTTATPEPAATEVPTVEPTATETPSPTAEPTATSDPTPVATTAPTATAEPTATAAATPTPVATSTPGPTPTPTPAQITHSGVFNIVAGEEFVISIESDESTGYAWELSHALDIDTVEFVDEDYVSPGATPPGTPGYQLFTFRGVTDGATNLRFWYVRDVDNPPVPTQLAVFELLVGDAIPVCTGDFKVDVGEEFVVDLRSNAGTGYQWQLSDPIDETVVTLVSDEYISPTTTAIGAAGIQRFTFRGIADGATTLKFWYIRPFDNPPVPAERAVFDVTVGPAIPVCDGEIEVNPGGEFQIILRSNPSTGYKWELSDAIDTTVVALVREVYTGPSSNAIGAYGWQRFTFLGVATGETTLKFWYIRPFDNPPAPAERATFDIDVTSGS